MFYAQFVLSKKGPLAKIWLAAHWEKKLTKAHVFETSIENSVEGILQPKVKMALRTSGHLLLGVVRIYSRKAKYLLADCNEAFVKIKMAFRPGAIDLPTMGTATSIGDLYDPLLKDASAFLLGGMSSATTLTTLSMPHVFHQFDTALSDLNDLDYGSLNQAREDEITLKEDFSHFGNDGFGVMADFGADDFAISGGDGFDHDVIMMDTDVDILSAPNYHQRTNKSKNNDINGNDLESLTSASIIDDVFRHGDRSETAAISFQRDGLVGDDLLLDENSQNMLESFYDKPLHDDGFGAPTSDGGLLGEGFMGEDGLFDEAPLSVTSLPDVVDDDDLGDTIQPLLNAVSDDCDITIRHGMGTSALLNRTTAGMDQASLLFQSVISGNVESDLPTPQRQITGSLMPNMTGSFNLGASFDQREVFALEPLDMNAISGDTSRSKLASKDYIEGPGTGKKMTTSGASSALPTSLTSGGRRKLVVDAQKGLDGDEMRRQLADTRDLVTDLSLAPPSKRLMQWKETGGCNKLLVKNLRSYGSLTRSKSPARVLFYNYPLTSSHSYSSSTTTGFGVAERECLNKLINLNLNSASRAITDIINRAVPSLNLTSVVDEESIYFNGPSSVSSSHHRFSPHKPSLSRGKQTPNGNETPPQNISDSSTRLNYEESAPHKRIKLDTIVESPNKKYDDYGDDDSHLSPGGYVDEGDDDDLYANNNNLSAADLVFGKPVSSVSSSHKNIHGTPTKGLTKSSTTNMPELDDDGGEIKRLQEREEAELTLTRDQLDEVLGENVGLSSESDQFAERVWGKRALLFFSSIQKAFSDLENQNVGEDILTFNQFVISDKSSRKAVAAKFYSLLVLKKDKVIELKQDEPYGTIFISKGSKYTEKIFT